MRDITYLYMEPDGSIYTSSSVPPSGWFATMDKYQIKFFANLGTFGHINKVDVLRAFAFGADAAHDIGLANALTRFLDEWFYCPFTHSARIENARSEWRAATAVDIIPG